MKQTTFNMTHNECITEHIKALELEILNQLNELDVTWCTVCENGVTKACGATVCGVRECRD